MVRPIERRVKTSVYWKSFNLGFIGTESALKTNFNKLNIFSIFFSNLSI